MQSVPSRELGLTLVWFLLELVIFSVGAIAFWNRPYDDAARMFFATCTVTLATFVGGFHWWTLCSGFWMHVPFAICGILLPAVILHFFLVYPRPKAPLLAWPKLTITAIYAIPVLTIIAFLIVDGFLWFLMTWTERDANFNVKLMLLNWLSKLEFIRTFAWPRCTFVIAQIALVHSWRTTRNPVERNQVQWIFGAGCVASFFLGYALYLAFFHREHFVLGGGRRLPMFGASLGVHVRLCGRDRAIQADAGRSDRQSRDAVLRAELRCDDARCLSDRQWHSHAGRSQDPTLCNSICG